MNNTKRSKFKVLDDGNPDAEGEVRVEHVGAEMRRARTEKGLTIPFLAETLRIRESYLVAIEDGRFDQLPGPTYALGFVRSYADYLGLDGREMVRRFKDEVGNQAKAGRSGRLAFPSPLAEGRGSFGALLVLALILGAAVYAGWYWYSDRAGGSGGIDAPVAGHADAPGRAVAPLAPAETAPAPGASPDRPSSAGESTPAGTGSTGTGSTGTGSAGAVAPSGSAPAPASMPAPGSAPSTAAPGSAPSAALPAVPAGTATPAQEGGSGGIVILARRDSWIQVRDDTGTMLTSSVLRAGETYRVPNRSGLTLMTGNAGGIEIVVDGRTLPPLGAEGTIRREISLDRDKLLSGAP